MEKVLKGTKVDVHAHVTAEIVRAIESGVSTYAMPWHRRAGSGLPRNAVTGKYYHGINTVGLWSASMNRGYALPYWATYRQWQTVGANVTTGERGSLVVFYRRDAPEHEAHDDTNEKQSRSRFLLRHSIVFNAEQVTGWTPPPIPHTGGADALEMVDIFVKVLGSDIRYGSDSAYYSLKLDRIFMPDKSAFMDTNAGSATEGFYAVLLHEHIHWSGHDSRLKRSLIGHYGSNAYAMEELVAELGAAFLCATLGISTHARPDHAAYIASWLTVLKQLKSAIFVAASNASLACKFLEDLYARNNAMLDASL